MKNIKNVHVHEILSFWLYLYYITPTSKDILTQSAHTYYFAFYCMIHIFSIFFFLIFEYKKYLNIITKRISACNTQATIRILLEILLIRKKNKSITQSSMYKSQIIIIIKMFYMWKWYAKQSECQFPCYICVYDVSCI